ncbi:MAG: response regulator transcription factor, partial [Vicingaceae bacterium]
MKTINLLLADDHTIIRDGIKLMLKKNPEFNIVAEANNGEEAISYLLAKPNTVDVILMDINMPEMNGIEATQYITNNIKGLNILALTMHAEETYITSMLRAGALGYILKEAGTSELMSAIKSVASGQKYYSNEVSVTMINALMNNDSPKSSVLSKRESEVLIGETPQEYIE